MGLFLFSCEDAEYSLDKTFDPENLGLEAPALFFHQTIVDVLVDDPIEIDLYSYNMDPAAAAYLRIRYDRKIVELRPETEDEKPVEAGDFFQGDNEPFLYWEEDSSYLDIYLYYLPDMNSDQSSGGTWSLAKIQFIAEQTGEFQLKYITEADAEEEPYTELRNANNEPVIINDFGTGSINVE